jgi:signal transduction histidine kinase
LLTITVVFLALAPALGMIFSTDSTKDLIWLGLLVGALALALGWFIWSDRFLRSTNTLRRTTEQLAAGDLTVRTGIAADNSELGELSRNIDAMAVSLQLQIAEREAAERTLLNRTHQQTVIASLGQFALASEEFGELLEQAVNFIAQTLQVEYAGVWEMQPGGQTLGLRSGCGWKENSVGHASLSAASGSLVSHTFTHGGTIAITELPPEKSFTHPPFFTDHGVVSTVCTVITGGTWPYGLLTVASTRIRKFSEDELHFLLAVATIIAMAVQRRHSETELQRQAGFAQFNPNPVMEFAADGRLNYFNEAAMHMANTLGHAHPQDFLPPDLKFIVSEALATGQSKLRHETRHGTRTLSWSFFPITTHGVVHCYAGDITERLNLESALRQSQKMESIGQLAAGVAHDFNNMLTIVQGHVGVIMAKADASPEVLDSAQAIYFASERAANLTRQLLMFSRKNIIQPRSLDLPAVVTNISQMLQRMIGEVVALRFTPPASCPPIRGDTGMIEQIIMNLGVNARDAMIRGGALTITVDAVALDAAQAEAHPQARPGKFVRLQVADTGHGMTAETKARIFEPFFTTKEIGKGTGLGLATVYGIVNQHEGWIDVHSQVGKGTTFEIFFPALTEALPDVTKAGSPKPAPQLRGGKETILVVEDEPVLRDLAQLLLTEQGYTVHLASNGHVALELWPKLRDQVDLLLTDMVMPEGIGGKELAEKLRATRPQLKVICVSGYSVEDIKGADLVFLQKPYTRHSLAKVVRDTLDAPVK